MSDSFIPAGTSGKDLQTYLNSVSGRDVHSEAVTITRHDGTRQFSGTWGYHAGTSGTLTMTGSKRVLEITATALGAAGSLTIDGGDTIPLPYDSTDKQSSSISIKPLGNIVDPEIIFTGTDGYFVQYIT